MRKIKEVLRLKDGGMSIRQVAKSCGVSRPTVSEYLRRVVGAGVSWPLPDELSDAALEHRLFPPAPQLPAQERGIPSWCIVHRELKRKGVTQFLLWQEYRELHPQGLYRQHQVHSTRRKFFGVGIL